MRWCMGQILRHFEDKLKFNAVTHSTEGDKKKRSMAFAVLVVTEAFYLYLCQLIVFVRFKTSGGWSL